MKIVIPALSLEKGGGARFLYQLGNVLVDMGHDVEYIIPEIGAVDWPARARITRVKEITPECFPPADFILPNFYPTVFPAWQSQKGQVVRLSLVYEPLCIPNAEVSKSTYFIDAPIITISQWQRQLVLTQIGRDSTVISGGADPAFFYPQPKLSNQTGRKNIFYIMRGAGYTWKGNEDFVKACVLLKETMADFDVYIVNPEPGNFYFTYPHQLLKADNDYQMARLYAQADLFVYTSYYESFGLPSLEAMACGTAVATTDCGGNRDFTRNGENCMVVPPGDVGRLADAMHRLLSDDKLRQSLADAGHAFAREWTWQRTAGQLLAVLTSIKG